MSDRKDESAENHRDESAENNDDESTQNNSGVFNGSTPINDNSGTAFSIWENRGQVVVEHSGDKEVKETASNTFSNLLTGVLRYISKTSIGAVLDTPLRAIGWPSIGVLLVMVMSLPTAILAPQFGYDRIGEAATTLAEFAVSVTQYIDSIDALLVAVVFLFPALYAFVSFLRRCKECGEHFATLHFTKLHHDRKEYNERLEKYVIPKDLVIKCRNCDFEEGADQHDQAHVHQELPSD